MSSGTPSIGVSNFGTDELVQVRTAAEAMSRLDALDQTGSTSRVIENKIK